MYGLGNFDVDTTGFDLMFKYNDPYFRHPYGMMPPMSMGYPYGARFNTGMLPNDVMLRGQSKPVESNAKLWTLGGMLAILGLGIYGVKKGFGGIKNMFSSLKAKVNPQVPPTPASGVNSAASSVSAGVTAPSASLVSPGGKLP